MSLLRRPSREQTKRSLLFAGQVADIAAGFWVKCAPPESQSAEKSLEKCASRVARATWQFGSDSVQIYRDNRQLREQSIEAWTKAFRDQLLREAIRRAIDLIPDRT